MPKKKKDAEPAPEVEKNTTEETAPEEEQAPEEEPKENNEALAKTDEVPTSLATALEGTDLFLDRFMDRILTVEKDIPTKAQMKNVIRALPDEHQEAVASLLRRTSGMKKGVYASNDRPEHTELRLYQGTGADPNRPETAIPGQFYLNTKENIGKVFEGTIISIWDGRTMWPDRDAGGAKMPVCTSMDRRVGSRFGECKDCLNLPWRDGKKDQMCGDDVVALMLPRDLSDIVLVRFSRTSEPAGRQLMRFARKGFVPWERWYRLTSEEHKNTERSFRWFTIELNVNEEEDVPEELYDFCEMLCTNAEVSFILPGISRIYRQAEDARKNLEEGNPVGDGPAVMKPGSTPNYDDMESAPDDENV